MFRLLLLTSLCWITVAGSTCPKGFKLFERNPTARNNHTKQWCLGIFQHHHDLGNREMARQLCISLNSSLSLPENQKEVDFALQSYNKTGEDGIAMDGEMRKKCKIQYQTSEIDFNKIPGDCNLNSQLFEFDDANSDFSFIQKHFNAYLPSQVFSESIRKFPGKVGEFSSCVILTKYEKREEKGTFVYGDTAYCSGQKKDGQKIHKVVCGTHPL